MTERGMIIEGVIIPAGWDQEGKVTAVAVSARDEVEYRIGRRGKGPELLGHINKSVSVNGEVEGRDRRKTITIRNYNLLSDP